TSAAAVSAVSAFAQPLRVLTVAPGSRVSTLSLHDALPIYDNLLANALFADGSAALLMESSMEDAPVSLRTLNFHNDLAMEGEQRSEEHTSELQSRENLVCRLLLEKK